MSTPITKIETIAESMEDLARMLDSITDALGGKEKKEKEASLRLASMRLASLAENLGNFSAVLDKELHEAQKALIDAKQVLVESFEHAAAINKPHRSASKIQNDILALLGE